MLIFMKLRHVLEKGGIILKQTFKAMIFCIDISLLGNLL